MPTLGMVRQCQPTLHRSSPPYPSLRRRHVAAALLAGAVDVVLRIVEEDVGTEGLQERALVTAAQEQCLVQAHAPLAQGADHSCAGAERAVTRGTDRRSPAGTLPAAYAGPTGSHGRDRH